MRGEPALSLLLVANPAGRRGTFSMVQPWQRVSLGFLSALRKGWGGSAGTEKRCTGGEMQRPPRPAGNSVGCQETGREALLSCPGPGEEKDLSRQAAGCCLMAGRAQLAGGGNSLPLRLSPAPCSGGCPSVFRLNKRPGGIDFHCECNQEMGWKSLSSRRSGEGGGVQTC